MAISFVPMVDSAAESRALVHFLTANRFPFHVRPAHSAESARRLVDEGRFWSEESIGFWIEDGPAHSGRHPRGLSCLRNSPAGLGEPGDHAVRVGGRSRLGTCQTASRIPAKERVPRSGKGGTRSVGRQIPGIEGTAEHQVQWCPGLAQAGWPGCELEQLDQCADGKSRACQPNRPSAAAQSQGSECQQQIDQYGIQQAPSRVPGKPGKPAGQKSGADDDGGSGYQ